MILWDFPDGPVAETPHFQFRESGFNPWSANQIPPAATWHSQIDKLNRLKSNNPLRQRGGKGKGELNSNSNIPKVTFPGLRQIPRTSSLLASKAHCCKVLQLEFYMSLHAGTSALEKSLAFLLFYFILFFGIPFRFEDTPIKLSRKLSSDKYPRETSTKVFQHIGARMSLAANCKQPKCPSAHGYIKLWLHNVLLQ